MDSESLARMLLRVAALLTIADSIPGVFTGLMALLSMEEAAREITTVWFYPVGALLGVVIGIALYAYSPSVARKVAR